MKRIRTIIVDDDNASIEKLQKDLGAFAEIKIIETTTSADTAKILIIKHQPDLLFLDVEMPEMSGIELLQDIQSEINPATRVVFYTAYNKYILDALRASAFDFLVKPYLPDELESVIKRVKKYSEDNQHSIEGMLQKLLQQDSRFAIQTITGVIMVKYDEVLLFEFPKNDRNWTIHFTNGKILTLRTTVSSKDILSITPNFRQINQNCIINLTHLASIENKTLKCKFYPPHDDITHFIKPKYYKTLKEILDLL